MMVLLMIKATVVLRSTTTLRELNDMDVSGINVQAIKTVQGGSAVATSNIEI
jgi:hypothetical protein